MYVNLRGLLRDSNDIPQFEIYKSTAAIASKQVTNRNEERITVIIMKSKARGNALHNTPCSFFYLFFMSKTAGSAFDAAYETGG